MPIWLEEGLCELVEGFEPNEDADRPLTYNLNKIQSKRMLTAGRAMRQTSPEQLLAQVTRRDLLGPKSDLYYSSGYSVALWLFRQRRLIEVLEGQKQGAGMVYIDPVAYRAFATDPGSWDEELITPTHPSKRTWRIALHR